MTPAVTIRPLVPGESPVCERILRRLPDWFGIEESLVQYVRDTERFPTWLAVQGETPLGFLTLHTHFPQSAEIHCIAVLPECHDQGVGRKLVAFAEDHLRARGGVYLQVKTMGPSRPCQFYDRTRGFYEKIGFAPLEEFHGLWGKIPCLLLVKKL